MYIQTKRLELKPVTDDAMAHLVELLTDDAVKQTYMVPDFEDHAAVQQLAERLRLLSGGEKPIVLGIYLDGGLIGLMNETERTGSRIEVGYALLPRFHNRGYATEALSAVIARLHTLGFRDVVAGAFEENAASLRVMAKSGMQKLEHTDEVEYRGKVHRCVYYGTKAGPVD